MPLFFLIPIIAAVLTGAAISSNYCSTDAYAQQQARAAGQPHTPSGDRLCSAVQRDREPVPLQRRR